MISQILSPIRDLVPELRSQDHANSPDDSHMGDRSSTNSGAVKFSWTRGKFPRVRLGPKFRGNCLRTKSNGSIFHTIQKRTQKSPICPYLVLSRFPRIRITLELSCAGKGSTSYMNTPRSTHGSRKTALDNPDLTPRRPQTEQFRPRHVSRSNSAPTRPFSTKLGEDPPEVHSFDLPDPQPDPRPGSRVTFERPREQPR